MEPITHTTIKQISDEHKEKISLIEDIFKVRRLLYGFGYEDQINVITNSTPIFDMYYEMDNDRLSIILAYNEATAMRIARENINKNNATITKIKTYNTNK